MHHLRFFNYRKRKLKIPSNPKSPAGLNDTKRSSNSTNIKAREGLYWFKNIRRWLERIEEPSSWVRIIRKWLIGIATIGVSVSKIS